MFSYEAKLKEDMSKIKFIKYIYGFDSGYYTKIGITKDNKMYVLESCKFTDDGLLAKALDEHVITIKA